MRVRRTNPVKNRAALSQTMRGLQRLRRQPKPRQLRCPPRPQPRPQRPPRRQPRPPRSLPCPPRPQPRPQRPPRPQPTPRPLPCPPTRFLPKQSPTRTGSATSVSGRQSAEDSTVQSKGTTLHSRMKTLSTPKTKSGLCLKIPKRRRILRGYGKSYHSLCWQRQSTLWVTRGQCNFVVFPVVWRVHLSISRMSWAVVSFKPRTGCLCWVETRK